MDDGHIRHQQPLSQYINMVAKDDDVLDEGGFTAIANAPRISEALDATGKQEYLQNFNVLQH